MAADGFLVAVRRISPSHLDYFAFLLHISPYSHFSFAFLLCISPSHFSFAFLLRISLLRISPSHFPFAFLLNSHFSFAFLLNSHFSFTFLSFAFLLRIPPSHFSFTFLSFTFLLRISPSRRLCWRGRERMLSFQRPARSPRQSLCGGQGRDSVTNLCCELWRKKS